MLAFFRKYQKIFFIFTTVIIVVSFAFFGSYQAFMPSRKPVDALAFKMINEQKVSQHELAALCRFLFAVPKGGIGNIFNDGVVETTFFQNDVLPQLVASFRDMCAPDLMARFEKEKRFRPYQHPKTETVSAINIWSEYAPEIVSGLETLQQTTDPLSAEALCAKVALFTAERNCPSYLLQRLLYGALREEPHLFADPKLERGDLSLFGYHSIEDWFGPDVTSLMAQVILNGAALAQQRGYKVSEDEVAAELLFRTNRVFRQFKGRFGTEVPSADALYKLSLRWLGFEETQLKNVYGKVLLFNRLLDDVGGAAVCDLMPLEKFSCFANESASVTIYQLPQALCLHTFEDLQQFEVYLDSVSSYTIGDVDLPTAYLDPEEIAKNADELLLKHYDLSIASISKSALSGKISVKHTWEWEVESSNYEKLKLEFPELALQEACSPEERFAIMQVLAPERRAQLDAYARKLILEQHPDWLQTALQEMPFREEIVTLGFDTNLDGIDDLTALNAVLQDGSEKQLDCYSQDQETFYKFKIHVPVAFERLSFEEAKRSGALAAYLKRRLVAHRLSIQKEGSPRLPLSDVADALFAPAITTIAKQMQEASLLDEVKSLTGLGRVVAPHRFLAFVASQRESETKLEGMEWALQPIRRTITRANRDVLSFDEALALEEMGQSELLYSEEEGPYFVILEGHKVDKTVSSKRLMDLQALLAKEARNDFFEKLLARIVDKNAFVALSGSDE